MSVGGVQSVVQLSPCEKPPGWEILTWRVEDPGDLDFGRVDWLRKRLMRSGGFRNGFAWELTAMCALGVVACTALQC